LGQFAKEVTRVSQEVGTEGSVFELSCFTPASDLFFPKSGSWADRRWFSTWKAHGAS
jgi:hypothetical protein